MMSNPAERGSETSGSDQPRGADHSAKTGAVPIFSAEGTSPVSPSNQVPTQGAGTSSTSPTGQSGGGGFGSEPGGLDTQSGPNPVPQVAPKPGSPAGTTPAGPANPTTDTIADDVAHSLKGLAFHGAAFGLVFGLFFGMTSAISGSLTVGDGVVGVIANTIASGVMGALVALGCGKLLNLELKRKVRRTTNPTTREKILRKGATLGRSEQTRVTAKSLVLFLLVSLVWSGGVALVTWIVGLVMVANGGPEPDISSSVSAANFVAIVLGIVLVLIRLVRFRRSGIYAGAAAVESLYRSAPGTY